MVTIKQLHIEIFQIRINRNLKTLLSKEEYRNYRNMNEKWGRVKFFAPSRYFEERMKTRKILILVDKRKYRKHVAQKSEKQRKINTNINSRKLRIYK